MTEEEIKAKLKAEAEAKLKADAEKQSELNKKLEELVTAVKAQSDGSANADKDAKAKADKAAAEKKLKDTQDAADIKKLLEDKKPADDFDYDDLKPKEILDIIAEAFETSIDAKTKLAMNELVKPIGELNAKIEGMQKYLIQNEAHKSVIDARAKFDDFDDFKEDIDKIYEMYPGIKLEHAYMLAKSEKSEELPPRGVVDTEKPMSLATRQATADAAYAKKEKKGGLGHRGFKAALDAAAAKVVSSRKT